jgi:cellulose biosynthesis protein BcsQ
MIKKHILAVCDLEVAYACSFVEYVNQKRNIPFDVQAFTNVDTLKAFAKEQNIEILLISDQTMEDEILSLSIGKIIILSQGGHDPKLEQYPLINKYQSSDNVIREVMSCYEVDKTPALYVHTAKKKAKLIGIYSPVGRAAKTSFALTLGQIMARQEAVLYLNLEEYSGFEQLLGCSYERTLGDLIYHIRQGNSNLLIKINSMIQSMNNLDYLPPALSPVDIQNTTYEEWMTLIQELIQYSSYETIVLDFGDGVADLYTLLDVCDKVYMPIRKDVISTAKIQHFEHLLQIWGFSQVLPKIQKIKLPYHQTMKQGRAYFDELVWSELGDYVRELLRKDDI